MDHVSMKSPHPVMCRLQVILILLVGAACVAPIHAQEACSCLQEWSAPAPALAFEDYALFHTTAAAGDSSIALAGNTTLLPWYAGHEVYAEQSIPFQTEQTLAVHRWQEGPIGKPAGDFWFLYPQVEYDTDGALHLVWLEPAPDTLAAVRDRADGRMHEVITDFDRVYHSTHEDGSWSSPKVVVNESAYWVTEDPPSLVAGDEGSLHLLYGNRLQRRSTDATHMYFDGEQWHDRSPAVRQATYSTLTRRSDGRLYLTFAAPVIDGPQDQLFLMHSDDDGATWSDPSPIHSGRVQRVSQPRLLVDEAAGRMHLIWGQEADHTFHNHLWHSVSEDEGQTWSDPARVSPSYEGTFHYHKATIDECGGVHSLFYIDNHAVQTPQFYYANWLSDTGWRDAEAFAADHEKQSQQDPVLLGGPEDGIHLFWSGQDELDWTETALQLHAVRTPCSDAK